MMQYRDFHYSDSDNPENNAATAPIAETKIDEEYETKLIAQLEAGEITQTQYDTLTKKNATNYAEELGLNEEGLIKGLESLPLRAEEESAADVPQEQVPQYQFDPNY